jgi:hypothetical protein
MKKFEVTAGMLVFSVKTDEGRKELILKKGEVADLPESDNAVRVLLARKQIREVPEEKKKKNN